MFITNTITKKILENLVHQTFSNFGSLSSSSLLDSLKFLGFYYATNAGISINIEDLKTPNLKKQFLKIATEEMSLVSEQWQQGFVSDTERFQSIIDSWNIATESLKNRIIDYYQNFDPANNLYIMAFSGARGNMSQVRQLVGMRGLMSDQEGKIIDLPIKTNFREGLSSIDYIISSYGARKGIVDTALKTADSGYLTRRLIYIAQDLIVRELDCQTKNGIIILVNDNTNLNNLVGRQIIAAKSLRPTDMSFTNVSFFKDFLVTESSISLIKKESPLTLNLRSALACQSNGSVCQKCYGWDLAQRKYISLGEAVGIIAAQSIGEPGTQLTMRTFHTGGIFTSEMLKQTFSPFSGKITIPSSLKTISYRTNHGTMVSKLQQETTLILTNWKGLRKEIFLEIGSFLYLNSSSFIRKNQLISEYSTKSIVTGARRLKPIYTPVSGEIRFESLLIRNIARDDKSRVKVNQDDGILWVGSGKIFSFPKEIDYQYPISLRKKKSLGKLKLITPYNGIVSINENQEKIITIINETKKYEINLSNLRQTLNNCEIKFCPLVKNYQYVDNFTILGYFEFYPTVLGKIYSVRKKESNFITTLFLITEHDIWKISSDQINNFSFLPKKKRIIRQGNFFNKNSSFSKSGFFLKKDGFKFLFQNAFPVFLSRGTILNYKQGDFVLEKEILATLVNYTQQTEDIVQGLPKIEELIEARIPKIKAYIAIRPGIFLKSFPNLELITAKITGTIILCSYDSTKTETSKRKKDKEEKQIINIAHSLYVKDEIFFYNDKLWKMVLVPPGFRPVKKKTKSEFSFINILRHDKKKLLCNGKIISTTWVLKESSFRNDSYIYKYSLENQLSNLIKIEINTQEIFVNRKKDLILKTKDDNYIFLENLHPITEYKLPLSTKLLAKPGYFIDIGEPITEGIINPHEILTIFFKYHSIIDGTIIGTLRSLNKFQLLLVNSIQAIYQSQGVNISSKHIEIIVRQLTAKVVIKESGDTPLLPGELIRISLISEISKALKQTKYKTPKYEPLFLSTTTSSLSKDGFLSAAGFQETKRVLTKAAIEGTSDWLRGLKECIIIGRLIPAGSAFLNYKNYLDTIYLFKD
jgi:hypothetical protein